MFTIILNRNLSDKQIDNLNCSDKQVDNLNCLDKQVDNLNCSNKQIDNVNCCYNSKLEAILNDNDLMSIIENMQSIYVCINFVKLYSEFKTSSKDTVKDLRIIGKCERIFNTMWTGDFFNKLKLL